MATGRIRMFFKDFGYKVIRLKYFIMIVAALILEIVTLTLYLLKLQDVVELELFNLSILYGAISIIIVVMAIGILVLIRVDKKRDTGKIKELQDFQRKYRTLSEKHLNDINRLVRFFENETKSLDSKLEYAELLEKKYDDYLKEFSGMKVPDFLSHAHSFESDHLAKEKKFYNGFTSLLEPHELQNIGHESEVSHSNFLKELHGIEKSLRLII